MSRLGWLGFYVVLLLISIFLISLDNNESNEQISLESKTVLPDANGVVVEQEVEKYVPAKKYLACFSVEKKKFDYDKAKEINEVAVKFLETRNIKMAENALRTSLVGYNKNMYRVLCVFSVENELSEVIIEMGEERKGLLELKVIFFGPQGMFLEQAEKLGFGDADLSLLYK